MRGPKRDLIGPLTYICRLTGSALVTRTSFSTRAEGALTACAKEEETRFKPETAERLTGLETCLRLGSETGTKGWVEVGALSSTFGTEELSSAFKAEGVSSTSVRDETRRARTRLVTSSSVMNLCV